MNEVSNGMILYVQWAMGVVDIFSEVGQKAMKMQRMLTQWSAITPENLIQSSSPNRTFRTSPYVLRLSMNRVSLLPVMHPSHLQQKKFLKTSNDI